jgi:hypothetical protein
MIPWSTPLRAPQHTAVQIQRRSKKCHPNFCRRITIFRVESTGVAFIELAAELLALPSYFVTRSATGCLSAVQTPVSTTPLTCEPNLRTILDPSGLLRDQSLATTTKTHRQLDVFPKFTHAS